MNTDKIKESMISAGSEVFDAEPPFTPRGCIAQAWSVAEVLRCWVGTEEKAGRKTGEATVQDTSPARVGR